MADALLNQSITALSALEADTDMPTLDQRDFMIAAIMGITTVITPVEVSNHLITIDMWIMLGASLWLAWLAWHKGRISRRSGVIMSSAYALYMVAAFMLK